MREMGIMKYTSETQLRVLELFNAMVVTATAAAPCTALLSTNGIVTDFLIEPTHRTALTEYFKPLDVKTLFGRAERDTASLSDLLTKQFLHYVEVYGLDSPGLFNLEVNDGKIVKCHFVKGITVDQLGDMVRKLLYTNAPIKNVDTVKSIITDFGIGYDISKIANNEARIVLFDEQSHVLENGDDAVRYMCFKATKNTMLIKSAQVLKAVADTPVSTKFLESHDVVLSQVFNRHKRIIVAAKNKSNANVINRITRLSKRNHVPVIEPIGKRFVSQALAGDAGDAALKKISIRDKFKILNLLEYKRKGHTVDAFVIRNGKIHIEAGRKVQSAETVDKLIAQVLSSLSSDLNHLKDKTILLDSAVDYGLPISRKQTLGNLPYGTAVTVNDGRISAGVYWHDEWGASDLDLSTIDEKGQRTGWGMYSGYSKTNPVTFSGDVTSAHNGAMEFMTSSDVSYGLFVNIFRGDANSGFELVVGRDGKDRWIKDTIIREKHTLLSRGNVIGFVNNNKFVVYCGRLNDNRWSVDNKSSAVVSRGTSEFWTVSKLFDAIGVKYVVDKDENVQYNYNMKYDSFSYNKLEELLLT